MEAAVTESVQDDYAEHMQTWRGFVRGVQVVVILLAATLAMLAVFLL
jgi:hypothetical protein